MWFYQYNLKKIGITLNLTSQCHWSVIYNLMPTFQGSVVPRWLSQREALDILSEVLPAVLDENSDSNPSARGLCMFMQPFHFMATPCLMQHVHQHLGMQQLIFQKRNIFDNIKSEVRILLNGFYSNFVFDQRVSHWSKTKFEWNPQSLIYACCFIELTSSSTYCFIELIHFPNKFISSTHYEYCRLTSLGDEYVLTCPV